MPKQHMENGFVSHPVISLFLFSIAAHVSDGHVIVARFGD